MNDPTGFLAVINRERAKNGVGSLTISPTLTKAAQWMAESMANNNYLAHDDNTGRTAFQRIKDFGYLYGVVGENNAAGNNDPETTYTQWYNICDPVADSKAVGGTSCSYAHRKNMLSPKFQVIGIGKASNPASQYGVYWVTDFGGLPDSSPGVTAPPTNSSFPSAQILPPPQTAAQSGITAPTPSGLVYPSSLPTQGNIQGTTQGNIQGTTYLPNQGTAYLPNQGTTGTAGTTYLPNQGTAGTYLPNQGIGGTYLPNQGMAGTYLPNQGTGGGLVAGRPGVVRFDENKGSGISWWMILLVLVLIGVLLYFLV